MSDVERKRQEFFDLQKQAIELCDPDAFRKMVEAWKGDQADVWRRTFGVLNDIRGKALALFRTFPPSTRMTFHMEEDDAMLVTYNQELLQNDLRYVQIFVEVMGRQPNVFEVQEIIKRTSQYFIGTNKVTLRVRAMDLSEGK